MTVFVAEFLNFKLSFFISQTAGQFYHHAVHVDVRKHRLHLARRGRVVPVREALVWDTVVDEPYGGRKCWYPEGDSPVEGNLWDYIVEDLLSVSYKYSRFKS